MVRFKEKVNPPEDQRLKIGPTKHPTPVNRYGLRCPDCGGLYYVDESIMRRVRSAQEGDPSELPFRCTDCEEQYAEQESGR